MRDLHTIIIHYSATYPDQDIGVEEIRRMHLERGWRDIGYHYVIRLDGTVEKGRPVEQQGAHARGHNADSIGICYVGGLLHDQPGGHDTRTPEQTAAIRQLVLDLRARYGDLDLIGHRDVGATECPGFDVAASDLHAAADPVAEPDSPEGVWISPEELVVLRRVLERVVG